MRIRHFLFNMRDTDPKLYEVAHIDCGTDDKFVVQVMESPTGKSVQIHVNNEQVWKGRA